MKMSISPSNGIRSNSTPQIVEIIGLAGSGKSTLLRSLCSEHDAFSMGSYLNVRNVNHFPYLLKYIAVSIPTAVRVARYGRGFTRREIAKTAYLSGWDRVLQKNRGEEERIILLDQGPIYEMATLYAFGPDGLKHPHQAPWWAHHFERWAQTIHTVIWLSAPMETLFTRINNREQWHPVKKRSVQDMHDYLLKYEKGFDYVMSKMLAIRDLNVLKLDSADQNAEAIKIQALRAIDQTEMFGDRQADKGQREEMQYGKQ